MERLTGYLKAGMRHRNYRPMLGRDYMDWLDRVLAHVDFPVDVERLDEILQRIMVSTSSGGILVDIKRAFEVYRGLA